MPELTGTVRCIRVGDDFGFTTVAETGTSTRETFILWWAGVTTPVDPPIAARIVQSDWVSMLREAFAGSLQVTVTHPDNSAEVLNVQLGEI
jgi:hypothetical protein